MKKFLLSLFALLALTVNASFAADKGYDQKIVIDNDRVRVMVVTWQPGAESPRVARIGQSGACHQGWNYCQELRGWSTSEVQL